MLASRVQLDIADQHHLVVIGVKDGRQHVRRVHAQPGELLGIGPRDPGRRIAQSVPVRVLSDGEQDFPDRALDPRQVELLAQRSSPSGLESSGRPNGFPSPSGLPPPSGLAPPSGLELPNPDGGGGGAAGSVALGDWPFPSEPRSLPSGAAVSASSLAVWTGGLSDGSLLP